MRITRNLEFQTGSKEEKLPYETTDFPYVDSQAELDDYREPFVPWHWHNAIELFYMESGQLKYHTPNETMVFSAGWAGMVNSNVLHMTEIQTHKEKNIQLLHIFEPKLLAGDHGSRIEQKYIMPITTSSQIEILPLNPKVPEQACNSPMATDEMIEELEQYNRDTVKIFQRGIEEGILKKTSPVLLISFCYYPIQQIFKEWRKEKSMIDTSNSGYVLTFSDKGDFLALAIELTLNDVISVLLDIDGDFAEKIAAAKLDNGTMTSSDTLVVSSIARLFPIMKEPAHRAFMEKHIKKEIIFYILCGSCGSQFLQSIINIQQAGEIYEINSWIKENFRHSFTVEELAEKRNMSVSLFHQKFKSAVGMGPLQCQKRLRLTEARRLMLDENQNVTEASMEVGYESVSQFTRDYRKMFGMNPKEDILRLRNQLEK